MTGAQFSEKWAAMAGDWRKEQDAIRAENRAETPTRWNLAADDAAQWFRAAHASSRKAPRNRAISPSNPPAAESRMAFYPGGVYSHLLSQKFGGLLTSPRFKIETDNISVKALGGKGAHGPR